MNGEKISLATIAVVGIVSEVLSIAAAGFAIEVIREIGRRQEETIQHVLPAGPFRVPPPPPVFDSPGDRTSQSTGLQNGPAPG